MNASKAPSPWFGVGLVLTIVGQAACVVVDEVCHCRQLTLSIAMVLMAAMCYFAESFHGTSN